MRERGIQVGIGGFHVSGTISMLGGADADLDRAKAMGVSLFAGEAEGRLDEVLRDAAPGTLKPLYNFMDDLPAHRGRADPAAGRRARRSAPPARATSFDAGRGCPYQCSFCTIINVQGRKSRRRSPDDVEKIVRANYAQGLHALLHHRRQFRPQQGLGADPRPPDPAARGREVQHLASSSRSTRCATGCRTSSRSARAPASERVFIGLENINPENLAGAKKRQNKITEYRKMLLAWKHARVLTYAGYILGFPNDTVESILHDIEVIKKELPVDLLEFFYLTPLPGSEDHLKLVPRRRRARSGHEQVRPQSRLRRASAHVGARSGTAPIQLAWQTLLHARAHRDGAAARDGDQGATPATRCS